MAGEKRWSGQIDKRTQRQLLGGFSLLVGVGAGVAGYSIFHEPLNIDLDQVTIRLPGAAGRLPDCGLRILHLSDTHFSGIAWREGLKIERIRRLTAELEYDLLVHTGDFWHEESGLDNVIKLLDTLPRPRLGGFGVFGNHDYVCYSHSDMLARNWERYQKQNGHTTNGHQPTLLDGVREVYEFARFFMNRPFTLKRVHFNDKEMLRQALAEKGVEILNNRSVHLKTQTSGAEGVDIHLAGVDDTSEGWPDVQKALADIPANQPTILLSHNPDILEEPDVARADVILCGHTHGGQIVLPWLGPVHTHSEQLGRHEAAGHLRRGKTQIYITRGVGEGIPLRFGARPQITLVTIQAEE